MQHLGRHKYFHFWVDKESKNSESWRQGENYFGNLQSYLGSRAAKGKDRKYPEQKSRSADGRTINVGRLSESLWSPRLHVVPFRFKLIYCIVNDFCLMAYYHFSTFPNIYALWFLIPTDNKIKPTPMRPSQTSFGESHAMFNSSCYPFT